MFSCRKALIRAIQPRTTRYDSRTLRRNHCVTSDDQRQHGEGDERQPPVHPQHHRHDADEREHVAEDRDDARGEQVVQHVDVGGDARHQPADRVAVVVAQVEPLQVAVDRHAQVEHDPLPGQLHRPGLQVLGGERDDQDGDDTARRAGRARRARPWRCSRSMATFIRYGCASAAPGADQDGDEGASATCAPVRPQVGRAAAASAARRRPLPRISSSCGICSHRLRAASSSSSSCFRCSSAYRPPSRRPRARRACRARRCGPSSRTRI